MDDQFGYARKYFRPLIVGASWPEQTDRKFCFMFVRFVCVCIAQANKLFSVLLCTCIIFRLVLQSMQFIFSRRDVHKKWFRMHLSFYLPGKHIP